MESEALKENITQSLKESEPYLSKFRSSIAGKDILVFLGNTKSGKSTTINYILGNQLTSYLSNTRDFKIRANGYTNGPAIGQNSVSCTAVPKVYPIPNTNEVAVDMPGFEDNRGVAQDITNTLCISQISVARTVKFVLVFDIYEILVDNIGNFVNSLRYLQQLLGNFGDLKNSICAIFTKGRSQDTNESLANIFKCKILDQEELAMDKTLLRNFFEQDELVGVFKSPSEEGPVTKNLDVNVKGAIQKCQQVNTRNCELKFSFSDKAQSALLKIYLEYTNRNFFKSQTNRIASAFDNFFGISMYVYASYNSELEETTKALTNLLNILREHKQRAFCCLPEIQGSLDKLLNREDDSEHGEEDDDSSEDQEENEERRFRSNFRFIQLLDKSGFLEEKYKNAIRRNYVADLNTIAGKIDGLIGKIQSEQVIRKAENVYYDFKKMDKAEAVLSSIVTVLGFAADAVGRFSGPYNMLQDKMGALPAAAIAATTTAGTSGITRATYCYLKSDIDRRQQLRQEQGRPVEDVMIEFFQNCAFKI